MSFNALPFYLPPFYAAVATNRSSLDNLRKQDLNTFALAKGKGGTLFLTDTVVKLPPKTASSFVTTPTTTSYALTVADVCGRSSKTRLMKTAFASRAVATPTASCAPTLRHLEKTVMTQTSTSSWSSPATFPRTRRTSPLRAGNRSCWVRECSSSLRHCANSAPTLISSCSRTAASSAWIPMSRGLSRPCHYRR